MVRIMLDSLMNQTVVIKWAGHQVPGPIIGSSNAQCQPAFIVVDLRWSHPE